jgi:small GTP-binding protein
MKTSTATTTTSRFGGVRTRRLGSGRGREGTGRAPRRNVVRVQGFLGLGSGRETTTTTTTTKDLFAGAKRAEVRIPGFCAIVDVRDVLENPDAVDRVLHAGATVVALQDSSPGETSGKTLYEAAAKLKTLVRGRACVLIGDRTDIALSAELDGVVLTDEGVPTVVARKSLPETAVVAVSSETAEDGETASKEGADLVLVRNEEVLEAIREKVSVPIFVDAAEGLDSLLSVTSLAAKGANGVTLRRLPAASESEGTIAEAVQRVTKGLKQNNRDQDSTVSNGSTSTNGVATTTTEPKKFSLVSADGEEMIDRERELIEELLAFLNENCSDLEEIKLLTEARKGLEELFLVVIVGEFNAGKSSVINAMLGDKFVAEGILPTTNEISVLRYGKKKSREQTEDGFFNVDVPADLLQQVRIVDTPGTNVILQRQQRLTEEFVPRADLVLFVLSADRPMTESEVKFLTYIRKWGKKVVFVVNKTDLLSEPSDVKEVMTFVKDNAERLLGVTNPAVLPVSSRNALKAKKSAGAAYGKSEAFIQSGFGKFEDYVMSFLGGTGERAGEALRLKLSTPLNVGELLLTAAEQILDEEDDQAKSEVAIATGVKTQMDNYKAEMIADAATQRAAARDVVASAVKRAEAIVDSSLRLSNAASLFSTYILGSGPGDIVKEYKTNVLGDSERQLKSAVAEFSAWLRRNNDAQLKAYSEAVESRGFDTSIAKLSAEWSDEQTMDEEGNIIETSSKASLNVASGFDHDAAAQLLDDAVRSAVNSTIGSAGGAFLVAFIATGYLNSFSEDVLVYALALAGAYISVLSLPLKRSEIKAKIRRTADTFLDELEQAMEKECTREVSEVGESVSTMCAPWEASARAEAARVAECIDARRRLKSSLDELLRDVANL